MFIFLKRQTTIPSAANTNVLTSSKVAPVEIRRGAVVAFISASESKSESFCNNEKQSIVKN